MWHKSTVSIYLAHLRSHNAYVNMGVTFACAADFSLSFTPKIHRELALPFDLKRTLRVFVEKKNDTCNGYGIVCVSGRAKLCVYKVNVPKI